MYLTRVILGHLRCQAGHTECIQGGQIQVLGGLEWTVIDAILVRVVPVERVQLTGGAWNVGGGDTARRSTEVERKVIFGKREYLTLPELWKVKMQRGRC